jgi:hypothetical protein
MAKGFMLGSVSSEKLMEGEKSFGAKSFIKGTASANRMVKAFITIQIGMPYDVRVKVEAKWEKNMVWQAGRSLPGLVTDPDSKPEVIPVGLWIYILEVIEYNINEGEEWMGSIPRYAEGDVVHPSYRWRYDGGVDKFIQDRDRARALFGVNESAKDFIKGLSNAALTIKHPPGWEGARDYPFRDVWYNSYGSTYLGVIWRVDDPEGHLEDCPPGYWRISKLGFWRGGHIYVKQSWPTALEAAKALLNLFKGRPIGESTKNLIKRYGQMRHWEVKSLSAVGPWFANSNFPGKWLLIRDSSRNLSSLPKNRPFTFELYDTVITGGRPEFELITSKTVTALDSNAAARQAKAYAEQYFTGKNEHPKNSQAGG